MREKTFSIVFNSDIFQVNKIVETALEFISGVFPDLSEDAALETKLVISEALLNAVTHGNDEDKSKKVNLKIKTFTDSSITIQITDEGEGFNYGEVMSRKLEGQSLLLESGRGIKLVCSLSDEVSYNRKGNRIKIRKKVKTDG